MSEGSFDDFVDFAETINRNKESLLWAAAKNGNTEECEQLINIGADVNWKNAEGESCLLSAARRGHIGTISLLINHQADVNVLGRDDMSPLHIAASRGDESTAEALLKANASTTARNGKGQTALEIARTKGHSGIYTLLMQRGSGGLGRPPSFPTAAALAEVATASLNPIRPLSSRSTLASSVNNNLITLGSSNISGESSRSAALEKVAQRVAKQVDALDVPTSHARRSLSSEAASKKAQDRASYSYQLATSTNTVQSRLNSNNSSNDNKEEVNGLLQLLESLRQEKKLIEAKLDSFVRQNKQLIDQFHIVNTRLNQVEEETVQQHQTIQKLTAESLALECLTLDELDKLENTLKKSLHAVETRKTMIIKNQIESTKEQRLCVICVEKEKTVVLLPCRHMCLCESCGKDERLKQCPLCRDEIVHRINVFS